MPSKIEKLRSVLKTEKLDGLIVTKPENVFYQTGFWGSFGFLVLTSDQAILLSDGRYRGKIEALKLPRGLTFFEFTAEGIKELGAQLGGNFGLENQASLSDLTKFKKWFSKAKIQALKTNLDETRRIKTKTEIDLIRTAQEHVDETLIPFLAANLKTGITEESLKFKLETTLKNDGQFGLSFDAIVAFGENSAIPHHEPGKRKLKSGDNILIDCGITHQRYCSDVTRNYVFGEAESNYLADYQSLLAIQEATLQKYQAGRKVAEIDQFCRDQMGDKAKFYTHSLGHGVGLEIHEMPGISTRSSEVLREHEVVTCEPGWYFDGQYGIRIEDLIVIRKDGPEILSHITKDLLSFDEKGHVTTLLSAA